jgi:hypothetical protein
MPTDGFRHGDRMTLALTAAQAVAFRVAAHGLDRRRPAETPLADVSRLALPDYPRGAALRSLGIRRAGVHADTLGQALAQGSLIRAMSLRGTTHVFAETDSSVFTTAALPTPGLAQAIEEALGPAWSSIESSGMAAVDALTLVSEEIAAVVADRRPRTKGPISEALHGRLSDGLEPWCARCRAHHVPEQLFRLAVIAVGVRFVDDGSELVAGGAPDLSNHAVARGELFRRFLGAYAPASARAFAEWTGLGYAETKAALAALDDEIVKVRLDGQPALALAADVERLRSPTAPTGVRLVPAGDAFLHQRDRATLVGDPARRSSLWRPAGAPGLVLADSVPVGTWRHKQTAHRLAVNIEAWTTLTARQRAGIEAEAASLAATQGPDQTRMQIAVTINEP